MSRNSGDDKSDWLGQSDPMTELALTIRTLRDGLQLSQEQLAEIVGVSRAAVSAWENGVNEPRGKRRKRLATALQVTEKELMTGDIPGRQKGAGALIAVQYDGDELPLIVVKSIEPALWAKTRQRVIVVEEKSGHRFGILATDETIQALTNCLAALRELL